MDSIKKHTKGVRTMTGLSGPGRGWHGDSKRHAEIGRRGGRASADSRNRQTVKKTKAAFNK